MSEAFKRRCGGCTECCRLIPVEELNKKAGQRCVHQRTGKGCSIYDKRPTSCREWSCLWLIGVEGEDKRALPLRRPDHVHYVIDQVPDIVRMRNNETGETNQIDVMQVWCNAKFPDAWKDPALLDMLERNGIVALVRYDSERGFGLFPPSRSADGKWHRSDSTNTISENLEGARRAARFDFWRRQFEGERRNPGDSPTTEEETTNAET